MRLKLIFLSIMVLVATSFISIIDANAQVAKAKKVVGVRPATGAQATDFELEAVAGSLEGDVRLSDLLREGPVALIVLRGFPGYQCGICSRQVGELVSKAKLFSDKNARVVMVYPGPAAELEVRAGEFLKGSSLPEPLSLLIDPDYQFTDSYGLRWDALRETAYPSTFVIGMDGVIDYVQISKGHGGRASAAEVLANL